MVLPKDESLTVNNLLEDDPILKAVEHSFSALILTACRGYDCRDKAIQLLQDINILRDSRLKAFDSVALVKNWDYFIYSITRLLFEKLSLTQQQLKGTSKNQDSH